MISAWLLMICFSAAAEESEPVISNIIITMPDDLENRSYWIELAADLIRIPSGSRFSKSSLETAVTALKQSRKFKSIHIDSAEENDQMTLTFSLTPYQLITDIRFSGLYPLFEKDVLNAMTLFIGDTFIEESLDEQKRLIETLYKNEGFIAPEVRISPDVDLKHNRCVLAIDINKGAWFTLDKLTFIGNAAFTDSRLRVNMKTWLNSLLPGMMGRFTTVSLKNDMETLLELYRSHRFADARLEYSLDADDQKQTVSVAVTIQEGYRYEVQFEGNEAFWDMTLRKDVELFRDQNINDAAIKKTISAIESRYHQAGYGDVSVSFEDELIKKEEESIRIVRFKIQEGLRAIVDSVSISGNKAVPDKLIKKDILTRKPSLLHSGAYVPSTLKEDTDAIRALYLERGYMAVDIQKKVTMDPAQKTTVNIQIDEGIQTIVTSLSIRGLTVISEAEAMKAIRLKPGEPYRDYMVKSDENSLAALISQKGYPHVKVVGHAAVSEDAVSAVIEYEVDEGVYVEMGEVYYSGNFKTRNNYLNRELKMKPGDPFSLAELLETQRNIRNMNVFNSVQFRTIGFQEKSERVNLFVELEEKKPYYIEAGAGYDTSKHVYVNAKGGSRNLFGTVKDAWISGEISQIGYRADIGVLEPRLFGTKISSNASIFAEQTERFNQYFGTSVYGAALGFSRKLTQQISAVLNFRYEQRNQYWIDPDVISKEEIDTRSIVISTPGLIYDSRDSFVNPTKGAYANCSADISKGIENTLDDFIKYRLDARYYLTPVKRLTLACAVRIGNIYPYGSDTVPDDQLFYLGGITDVRGFQENMLRYDPLGNPIGGRQALSGSLEARIDMGYNFELTGFYDFGKINDLESSDDDSGYRSAAGGGIRYKTPIGPISFVYGFKLDPQEGESTGRFHFSLGYTF